MEINYNNLFVGLALWLIAASFIWLYYYSTSQRSKFKPHSPFKLWIGAIGFIAIGAIFVFGAFGIDIVRIIYK